jgi:hypothetical protein
MKKFVSSLLVATMTLGLVSCAGKDLPTGSSQAGSNKETVASESSNKETDSSKTEEATEPKDLVMAKDLKINFATGNNQRTITYNQATPLKLPDGKVVSQGELKPVWQELETRLGVNFEDVTIQDQQPNEMIDIAASTGFNNANIYGGNSVAEALMSYGAQGYFVAISDYMDQLPNFNAYLDENPDIRTSITAYDGKIYHIPYVAEIGNYARMYHVRQSWVESLLDSEDAIENETATLPVHYEGYWKDHHPTNVANLQNEAAENGELTAQTARKVLLDYIKETYPSLAKPSDLYLGSGAQYDIDELIALFRVVKLHPNTLSKVSTGKVVDGAVISPYFTRHSKYREELLRLANYFGGQHVHGSDSYGARFYLNAKGELCYSYNEDNFLKIVESLKDMYSEGLVFSEFSDLSLKDNFRDTLYSHDDVEGQTQFGFMTYDWTASTTAAGDDIIAVLPPVTTMESSKDFVHYVENTRVVKPDGWAISSNSTEEEINAALKLFDYFFSEEGHILQNYGIPAAIDENEKFVAFDGMEYPKFSSWVLDTAEELKNGDVAAFLRDFVGALIPVGYQKEIGFELQYTNENGMKSWEIYNDAKVIQPSYTAENPELRIVPPVFSLNEQDVARINNTSISPDQVDMIFQFITSSGGIDSIDQVKQAYNEAGIDEYIKVYQEAYARMAGE